MKVFTHGPIIIDNLSSPVFSNSEGEKTKEKRSLKDKAKDLFHKKDKTPMTEGEKHTAEILKNKKEREKKEAKFDRQLRREDRIFKRRAKRAARKLKPIKTASGKEVYKDELPIIKPKKDLSGAETFTKTLPPTAENPDPVLVPLKKEELIRFPSSVPGGEPTYYDKSDIKTEGEVKKTEMPNGDTILHKEYEEHEVEKVPEADGTESVYKKADVIDKDAKDDTKPGMSKGLKIGLIVGGSVLLLAGIILIVRAKSKKA